MKSITEIIGGKQYLFEGFHELQQFFEGHLSGEYLTFAAVLQIIEDTVKVRYGYKGVGRIIGEGCHFIDLCSYLV